MTRDLISLARTTGGRVHCGLLAMLVALVACSTRADVGTTPLSEPPAPANAQANAQTDAQADAQIDLGPAGMAAVMTSSTRAEVQAHEDWLEIRGGSDYLMHVHRGDLDLLDAKTDIVREYGVDFEEFVRDDEIATVYRTSDMGEARWHFIATREVEGLSYWCSTADEGVETLEAVNQMIEDCLTVELVEDVEPDAYVESEADR